MKGVSWEHYPSLHSCLAWVGWGCWGRNSQPLGSEYQAWLIQQVARGDLKAALPSLQ